MDAHQDTLENPFSMDEACANCPALADARTQVVHGYGDVGAEFVVVGERPGPGADEEGVPFAGDADGRRLRSILRDLGFTDAPLDDPRPDVENVFLTYLTRCRHADRPPTTEEVGNCDPFLTAELRMINPELIVPVGQRPLEALAREYTTRQPDDLDVEELHATTLRGRGFELVPMLELDRQTDVDRDAFVEHFTESVLGRDYRQTKGRRGR